MKATQRVFYNMVHGVSSVCNEYQTDWAGTPSFAQSFALLQTDVLDLWAGALALQLGRPEGVTIAKREVRATLEGQILTIAGGVKAYAFILQEETLQRSAHLTLSAVRVLTDRAVIGEAERVATLATDNLSGLGPYGITTAKVKALRTLATTYSGWLDKPRAAMDARKEGTKRLKTIETRARQLLETMDAQMVLFKTSAPAFYQRYFYARDITKPGFRHLALSFKVREGNGQPVAGAIISIPALKLLRRTAQKGGCLVKRAEPGVYACRVVAEGFAPQEIEIALSLGEHVRVAVVLERISPTEI